MRGIPGPFATGPAAHEGDQERVDLYNSAHYRGSIAMAERIVRWLKWADVNRNYRNYPNPLELAAKSIEQDDHMEPTRPVEPEEKPNER